MLTAHTTHHWPTEEASSSGQGYPKESQTQGKGSASYDWENEENPVDGTTASHPFAVRLLEEIPPSTVLPILGIEDRGENLIGLISTAASALPASPSFEGECPNYKSLGGLILSPLPVGSAPGFCELPDSIPGMYI